MRRFLVPALAALTVIAAASAISAWMVFGSNTREFEGSRSIRVRAGSPFIAYVDSLESAGILDRRWSFELVARTFGWDAVASHYIDHLSESHSS